MTGWLNTHIMFVKCISSNILFKSSFPYWSSVWMISPLLNMGYLNLLLLLYCHQFLSSDLLYSFRCSNNINRCINIYKYSLWWAIFIIIQWPSLFLLTVFCSKSFFSYIKYSYPSFLLISICMRYLFLLFIFSQCMSLKVKWVLFQVVLFCGFVCLFVFFPKIHSATLHLWIGNLVILHLK